MSANLSRRDFLKGAALGAASIGVLGLTGCGTAPLTRKGKRQPRSR